MNKVATTYFMEDSREAKRLANKVDAPRWVDAHFARHLKVDSRVLDVGCGPGVLAAEVALRIPSGSVTGLDASEDRLIEARKNVSRTNNARVQLGEATALPFEPGSFDFIYCRFLMEYLQDKQKAVSEMVSVCRPGGTVLLQDLDGQLVWHYPVDEELQSDIEQTLAVLAKSGFDPFVGRKLYFMARQAGLKDVKVRAEPYHLIAGIPTEEELRLWELKLDIALPAISQALGSANAANKLRNRFLDYLRREDSLSYSVLFTVIGTKSELQAES